VLRVGFKNEHGVEIISSVNDIKNNRRSLPSAITNAVVLPTPAVPSALSNSASSSPHRHVAANRRSKDCHSACISSGTSADVSLRQVRLRQKCHGDAVLNVMFWNRPKCVHLTFCDALLSVTVTVA